MARPSRSKKQPAFDPSEIEDLIFSPVIGTGVGSHLIADPWAHASRNFETDTPNASIPDLSTVVELKSPVRSRISSGSESIGATLTKILDRALLSEPEESSATGNLSTVVMSDAAMGGATDETKAQPAGNTSDVSTVVDLTTVDTSGVWDSIKPDLATVDISTTVARSTTDAGTNLSTVDMSGKAAGQMWLTEDGDRIAAGRVKRIRLAQDVINAGEEAVYDTLWNAKPLDGTSSDFRIVQVGYDFLMKRTRLAKKTVQRIIDKLIDKDFVAIERPADIYQRMPTVYRVFGYKTVLERHVQKGRSHVAKVGPGFSYVHPVEVPRSDISDLSTVVKNNLSTVVKNNLSTVVKTTTLILEHSELEQTSSSGADVSSVVQMLRQALGIVDDDVASRLLTECRRRAPDATVEEISEFVQQKATFALRNPQIRNPSGFLITAVPRCFEGESFQIFRKSREETKRREKAELQRIAMTILETPESSDEDRNWAQAILSDTTIEENAPHSQ